MIILLGLPKSGTTSFNKLFSDLNYNTYHFIKDDKYIGSLIYENKIKNKPLFNDFLDSDVITQMDICINNKNAYWPQITDYKQIYNEKPNSLFILNKRDPKKILNSFKNWGDISLHERICKYNPELVKNKSDKCFIDFVINHYNNIETFFSQQPDCNFISFDIENDSLQKIFEYIDIGDFTELPHENINYTKKIPLLKTINNNTNNNTNNSNNNNNNTNNTNNNNTNNNTTNNKINNSNNKINNSNNKINNNNTNNKINNRMYYSYNNKMYYSNNNMYYSNNNMYYSNNNSNNKINQNNNIKKLQFLSHSL